MPLNVREITCCRACSGPIESVFDLGMMAINAFPRPGESLDYAPLDLVLCQDCGLVQLRHTVERDHLYRDYYYRSGLNESMVLALRDVAREVTAHCDLQDGDAVIDIGANDGTLLDQYRLLGKNVKTIGFEPSHSMALWRLEHGNPHAITTDYWPPPFPYVEGSIKAITSVAVFYDADDPAVFVEAVARALAPDGVWIVQMMDLWSMIRKVAVDNICHEHLTYWSLPPLRALLRRFGLDVVDMTSNHVNGGSVRYVIKHRENVSYLEHRNPFGIRREMEWFRLCAERARQALPEMIRDRNVLGYAASTKANTLLQYCGIGPDLLPAIADRNPDKWGRQTVTGIPIISEEEMRERDPDYLLALAWGFLPAFREREKEWESRGGQWIVPLPTPRIVGGESCRSITAAASGNVSVSSG